MIFDLELPFPDRHLLPNEARRNHWGMRAEYAKTARMVAYVEAANKRKWDYKPPEGELSVKIVFHEPNKRARDLDGLLSAMKPSLDGIANALDVDDKRFNPITIERGERIKGGCVRVEIKDGTLGW